MRFFRRGGQPDDRTQEQPQQPDETADDVIGDEWRQGSPDEALSAELPLGAAPAVHPVTGGGGIVEPVHVPDAPQPSAPPEGASAEGHGAIEPEPSSRRASRRPDPGPSRSAPEPPVQWAWGADYSPEKADAARREREREQLEAGLEKSRTGFGARLRSAFGGGR